jgi:AcrR family transcriptional regulator
MPRRYSMDVRAEETAARRRQLLDAAIEVLAESGADRLTMEAVAKRADVATRTLYNHFSTRDELIAAALQRLLQEYRDAFDMRPPGEGDPPERLRSFARVLYDTFARQGRSITTLLDHREDPQIDAQITEQRRWHRRQLEDMLRDAKPDLLVPLRDAVAIAFALTNPDSWRTLTEECGLTQAKALALTTTTLDATLFGQLPGRGP